MLSVNEPDMVMSNEGDNSPFPDGSLQPELKTAASELVILQGVRDKRVRFVKPTFIPPWSEKPVLVTCNVAGLVIITPYEKNIRKRMAMVERGVMYVRPGQPFYVLMANTSATAATLPKNMLVSSAQNVPHVLFDTS